MWNLLTHIDWGYWLPRAGGVLAVLCIVADGLLTLRRRALKASE
jgi:hypothetical protein